MARVIDVGQEVTDHLKNCKDGYEISEVTRPRCRQDTPMPHPSSHSAQEVGLTDGA